MNWMPGTGNNGDGQKLLSMNEPKFIAGSQELKNVLTSPRRIILCGLAVLLIFFGGGGLWVSLAKISGAVIFQGIVKVQGERQTVQHLEGGIIKEILVRNGARVVRSQPLIVLESSRINAAVDQIQVQLLGQMALSARLEAEKNLAEAIVFPPELLTGQETRPEVTELLAAQTRVFQSRRTALHGEEDLLRSQIEQIGDQIASIQGRIKSIGSIVASLDEELAAKEILLQDQFIDKTSILQLRRQRAENEGLRSQFLGMVAENREKIAALKMQLVSLRTKYVESATTELAESGKAILDLQDRLRPLQDARQRLTVTAPISGEVVGMAVHSVGGVLGAGQPILDIVPEESPLVIEGKIMPNDITHITIGQKAEVQLLAFETRTTPKIPATVRYISADRMVEPSASPSGAQSFYQVQVDVDKTALRDARLYLTPGMSAAVYILTKERTILEYATEPLLQNFSRALREK